MKNKSSNSNTLIPLDITPVVDSEYVDLSIDEIIGIDGIEDILKTPRSFINFELERLQVRVLASGCLMRNSEYIEIEDLANSLYLDFQEIYANLEKHERVNLANRTRQDMLMALGEFILQVRKKELEALRESLRFEPNTVSEVEKFQIALIGEKNNLYLAVLRHFIWQVRRKIFGKPVSNHMMLVLFGPQGSGKSKAIENLLSVLGDLVLPTTVMEITDERFQPQLSYHAVAFLDEMAGASKGDIEKLKHIITANQLKVRRLGTNNVISATQNCTFIGATNKQLKDQIRDSTGMRRFFQLDTQQKIAWDLINEIDYLKLWKEVDENIEEGFLSPVWKELQTHQQGLISRDEVDDFILEANVQKGSKADEFISTEDLYSKFRVWSANCGHLKPLTKQVFAKLLVGKSFLNDQKNISGKSTRGFYIGSDNELNFIKEKELY